MSDPAPGQDSFRPGSGPPNTPAANALFSYAQPGSREGDELRDQLTSPLIHILGCSERLLQQATANDSEEWIINLQQIQLSAQHLFLLLNTAKPATEDVGKKIVIPEPDTDLLTLQAEQYIARSEKGSLLIVDDSAANRDLLALLLEQQGYSVAVAETGEQGLWMIQTKKFDLMLLDLVLPQMNGYEVLKCMKSDMELRHIPVIMLSGLEQQENVIRCIEIGAEDFLPKPFNPILLRARINACLEKKRLRDHEQAYVSQLQIEQEKSESLLLNILPKAIADRLKRGERTIVDAFPEVTVLFADLAGFTELSTHLSPTELVERLDQIFSEFDLLVELYDLEKIKTIGDAYMVVGGLPTPRPDHARAIAGMALDMQSVINRINARNETNLRIRVGINTGPVIAGIIGKKKFIYDLWGDTVNVASRMESHGHPGHIQITDTTYQLIKDEFIFAKRGTIEVKGRGEISTWLIMARRPDSSREEQRDS